MAKYIARSNLFAPQGVGRPEIGDTGNPIPVREWEENYYKPRDPEIVARGAPAIRGSLYVPEPPVDPPDIVPKSYVDGLMAGQGVLSNPWQPYIVGHLFMGNWMTTMAGASRVRPSAYLSIAYLSDLYYFDMASCHTWLAAGAGATAHLGVYDVDQDTLLPTNLRHDFGTTDISATGQHDILLSPPRGYGPGMYGFCIQNEGGSSNPAFTFEMSQNHCTPFGFTAPTVAIGVVQYAFQIGVGDIIPGSLPLPGVWAYSQLQSWGSGLALRRSS